MLEKLVNWKGSVSVNDTRYSNISEVKSDITGPVHICLYSKRKIQEVKSAEMRITVRAYMTKKSTEDFDFMLKWNNDIPMPLRTMVGTVEKETKGMVYMNLHGDVYADRIQTCMKCGRPITNPVSQYFGMGPECGGHNYVNPFETEEELREAVSSYRKELQKITWKGWIIKSAIIESEEL